jgi:23S rRNA pseudouridine1911/1915/1917 synthase
MSNLSVQPNERITYKLVHEDADVVAVVKPSGIVTAPGKGHDTNSLLNGLFAAYGPRLQNIGRERDFGLLHRLDKFTSGLVVVALTKSAYDAMREAWMGRNVAKYYWAVVRGVPKTDKGVISRPIAEYNGRSPGDVRLKKLARISSAGKPSVTAYRVLASTHTGSLVECRAVTGRLHQVRVHMESIGCPILGDELYAPLGVRDAAPRLALHAHRVVFPHPTTGETLDLKCGWPSDLRGLLKGLGLPRPDLAPAKDAGLSGGDTGGLRAYELLPDGELPLPESDGLGGSEAGGDGGGGDGGD